VGINFFGPHIKLPMSIHQVAVSHTTLRIEAQAGMFLAD
jgi:hypothetical protein